MNIEGSTSNLASDEMPMNSQKKVQFMVTSYKRLIWIMALALFISLSACTLTPAPPEPIYYYTLDYRLDSMDLGPILPVVIRIDRFSVSPPFESQRIIYADKGLHRNAYARHHWISPPGELMAYLIARDLRGIGRFQTVLTPDSPIRSTHIVNGWVEKFLEEDGIDHWQASLCLHITLLVAENQDPTKRILFQNTYRAEAVSEAKTPAAIAEAMSKAAAQVSSALIRDIYDCLEKNAASAPKKG